MAASVWIPALARMTGWAIGNDGVESENGEGENRELHALETENNALESGNPQPRAPLSFLTALSSLLKFVASPRSW